MSDLFGDTLVRARPWPEIVDHYASLAAAHAGQYEPMVALVRHVAEGRLAQGLFATTSMHTLVVSQAPRFPFNREVLRIDFDPQRQLFHFEFIEGNVYGPPRTAAPRPQVPVAEPLRPWTKTCTADRGIAALEHFLFDQKKWFSRRA